MQEAIFTLKGGKEVPERLDGTEIRFNIPDSLADIATLLGCDVTVTVSGPDAEKYEKVTVDVFTDSFILNHRQKIAKRFAARDGSTAESITEGMLKHTPGVRTTRDGITTARQSSIAKAKDSVTANILADLRAKGMHDMADAYEAQLAEINAEAEARKAEAKAKKEAEAANGATETATA